MAIVPLKECKIPTLIPAPVGAAALALGEAVLAVGEALGAVVLVGAQALSNTLPAAVEPRIKISRRLNFLAIGLSATPLKVWI